MIGARVLTIKALRERGYTHLSNDWLRRIACDQKRPLIERRLPQYIHDRFPPFEKDGRDWVVRESDLARMNRR